MCVCAGARKNRIDKYLSRTPKQTSPLSDEHTNNNNDLYLQNVYVLTIYFIFIYDMNIDCVFSSFMCTMVSAYHMTSNAKIVPRRKVENPKKIEKHNRANNIYICAHIFIRDCATANPAYVGYLVTEYSLPETEKTNEKFVSRALRSYDHEKCV